MESALGFLRTGARSAAFAAVALLLGLPTLSADQRRVPGAFRARVVLVPVDVRVVDAAGNPVTDLQASDFTVLENGVPQEIGHFSTQAFAELSPGGEAPVPVLRRGPGLASTPQTHRTFLIVLGRGRLMEPSDGMDALIEMVQSRLLPHDHVGVVAYNRVSGLTMEREPIVRFLETYRERHQLIEARLDHWFSGFQLRFGSPENPPGIQKLIDDLFAEADLPEIRDMPVGRAPGLDAFEEAWRAMAAALDPDAEGSPAGHSREGFDDLRNLFAGIEFLRFLEGEKHLVLLTENGFALPGRFQPEPGTSFIGTEAQKEYGDIAVLASDARVTVSIIQTGGTPFRWSKASVAGMNVLIAEGRTFGELFTFTDNRALAQDTGGMAFFYRYANDALDRIERATRFQYLLGYYPSNAEWDGGFREIDVRVNRPGARVLYRHGYFAQEELVPYDRREFLSHSRIMAAGADWRRMRDLPVSLAEVRAIGGEGERQVELDVVIDAARVRFVPDGDRFEAALTVAVFVGDGRQKLVGEYWQQVDLSLDAGEHARASRENIAIPVAIKVSGDPRHLKAIVYDYRADRLGTANGEVK